MTSEVPKLGHHLEICFSVDNLGEAIDYYASLGFKVYSGGKDKGWCTVTDGLAYFSLFPDNFIEREFGVKMTLNYRGGNVTNIAEKLKEMGIKLENDKSRDDGTGNFIFEDIAGNRIFIDTAPDEDRIDIPNP